MMQRIPSKSLQAKKAQSCSARSRTTLRIRAGWVLICGAAWFTALPDKTHADDTSLRQPANFINLEAIERVKNGKEKIANAAWWGFDEKDATAAIQGAINSGAKKVLIPYMGRDWIVRPIKLAGNQEIILDPGVVVMAKEGAFKGKQDCLFEGIEVENVTIRGYGATLRMRKKDYTRRDYEKSEFRHALSLKGVKNVKVLGLRLESSGGDGIYLGPTWDDRRIPCRSIQIRDCICDDNYRQGISVVSAEHVRIENCILTRTDGTPPQSGLDLEPSHPRDLMDDIRVTECTFERNAGSGYIVSLTRLNSRSRKVDIVFERCFVRDCQGLGVQLRLGKDPPRGLVEFRHCTWERVRYAGLKAAFDSTAMQLQFRFQSCVWNDVAHKYAKAPPFYMELQSRDQQLGTGGIQFVYCNVYDYKKRPLLKIKDSGRSTGRYPIAGEIQVINAHFDPSGGAGRVEDLKIDYRRPQD